VSNTGLATQNALSSNLSFVSACAWCQMPTTVIMSWTNSHLRATMFPQSNPWRVRKLWARLEKYACLSAGTSPHPVLAGIFSQHALFLWIPGHNGVPGNVTHVFCHNHGLLLYITWRMMNSNKLSLVPGCNSVPDNYIYFCRSDGWLLHIRFFCGGYYILF